jgi:hypothetical protein
MHDLISYNCPEIIKNVTKLPTELSSFPTDHYIIKFQIQQAFFRAKAVKRIVFVYLRGNFDGLRSFFSRMLVTMERMVFKGCLLFKYYILALENIYDVEDPRTWRSVCIKCNSARSVMNSPLTCCF